jgi:hypothetical protein
MVSFVQVSLPNPHHTRHSKYTVSYEMVLSALDLGRILGKVYRRFEGTYYMFRIEE